MIEYKTGDILDADVEAIVNTVNCVGVMGRGIALQFKNAWPNNFKAYEAACQRGEVQPGRMFVFPTGQAINPLYVINFPTKRHWKGKSRMEDIDLGLDSLVETIREYQIKSIAIPPLGCGLGGLNWDLVRSRIENVLQNLKETRVVIFEPAGSSSVKTMKHVGDVPEMTPGRAALLGLMDNYLHGLLDPFVTLLEVHKLAYFMQEAGEPLRLKIIKHHYGPYAENLRHVLNTMEGHYISGYADGGDQPDKQLQLMPTAVKKAEIVIQRHPETQARFQRVVDLVEGFESPFGLELLSTVHWVVKQEAVSQMDDIVERVHDWNERKIRMFVPRQINVAVKVLSERGWMTPPVF